MFFQLFICILSLIYQENGQIVYFPYQECPEGWKEWKDAAGRFIIAAGDYEEAIGENNLKIEYSVNETGGSPIHYLSVEELPRHRHAYKQIPSLVGIEKIDLGEFFAPWDYKSKVALHPGINQIWYTQDEGGDEGHSNVPQYLALKACYKSVVFTEAEKKALEQVLQENINVDFSDYAKVSQLDELKNNLYTKEEIDDQFVLKETIENLKSEFSFKYINKEEIEQEFVRKEYLENHYMSIMQILQKFQTKEKTDQILEDYLTLKQAENYDSTNLKLDVKQLQDYLNENDIEKMNQKLIEIEKQLGLAQDQIDEMDDEIEDITKQFLENYQEYYSKSDIQANFATLEDFSQFQLKWKNFNLSSNENIINLVNQQQELWQNLTTLNDLFKQIQEKSLIFNEKISQFNLESQSQESGIDLSIILSIIALAITVTNCIFICWLNYKKKNERNQA